MLYSADGIYVRILYSVVCAYGKNPIVSSRYLGQNNVLSRLYVGQNPILSRP